MSWHHDWEDESGEPEHVLFFKLYLSKNDSPFVYYGETEKDSIEYRPDTTFTFVGLKSNSKYKFGVSAVDWAGNESLVHFSTSISANNGGWYVITDSTPPSTPSALKPE